MLAFSTSTRPGVLAGAACGTRRTLLSCSKAFPTRGRHGIVTVAAEKGSGGGSDKAIQGIVSAGNKLVDQTASFVPESVPRPVAKAGVTLAFGLFVFGMIQKVVSGVFTLIVLGGVAYYFFTRSDDDGDDGPKRGSSKGEDLDDPLSEARKIMEKYK